MKPTNAINIFSGQSLEGRVDVARAVKSTETAMFLYDLPPGHSSSPYHYEYAEEWLLVVDGTVVVRVRRGSAVPWSDGEEGWERAV